MKRIIFIKLFSISLGFVFSLFLLEVVARLLPSSDTFSLEFPVTCHDLERSPKISLQCLLRRQPYYSGVYTRGAFPPFPVYSFKNANDIGQFSDINFNDFIKSSSHFRILSIGDSFVEALHVPNPKSFHGLLNDIDINSFTTVSTAIGASGSPLSQYLVSILYAKQFYNVIGPKSVVVVPIIPNDFDESVLGLKTVQVGAVFDMSDINSPSIKFRDYFPSLSSVSRRGLFAVSALSRYVVMNLQASVLMYKYPFCLVSGIPCPTDIQYKANVFESSYEDDPDRYDKSYRASSFFLKQLRQALGPSSDLSRVIFVVDSDRRSLYTGTRPGAFFDSQRRYFIDKARAYGFTVVDMQPVFRRDFLVNHRRFDFINDAHWNSYGHSVVASELEKVISSTSFSN